MPLKDNQNLLLSQRKKITNPSDAAAAGEKKKPPNLAKQLVKSNADTRRTFHAGDDTEGRKKTRAELDYDAKKSEMDKISNQKNDDWVNQTYSISDDEERRKRQEKADDELERKEKERKKKKEEEEAELEEKKRRAKEVFF
jgi:hypothetical protein